MYPSDPQLGRFCLKLTPQDGCAHLQIEDDGQPFNPREVAAPSMTSLQEMAIGGLGIKIVRKLMAECRYAYRDGYNCLTLITPPLDEICQDSSPDSRPR